MGAYICIILHIYDYFVWISTTPPPLGHHHKQPETSQRVKLTMAESKLLSLTGDYLKELNTTRRLVVADVLTKNADICNRMEGAVESTFDALLEDHFTSKLKFKTGYREKFVKNMKHVYSVATNDAENPQYPTKAIEESK